jgi:3-hydroxyacyl-CoA dehydrogenase
MAAAVRVLSDLDRFLKPDALLTTNTSYLDVNQLAAASGRPDRFLGLHFFSPAEIMKLLEVVRGAATSAHTLATGLSVGRRLRKIPVVAGVCDGFIGNRILMKYRREMEYALEDGASPEQVDGALEAWGFAMGPFAVSDLSGLDIAWAQRKRLAASRPKDERYVAVADRLCEMGRLGRKVGRGWYQYQDGKRQPDPDVLALIEAESAAKRIRRRFIQSGEIQIRARAAIVNEAAQILGEGIARTLQEIDLVMVHGYGFPRWRGGPMQVADAVGLDTVLADVRQLHDRNGTGFEPAPLLEELAASGQTFADWAAMPRA